jgi:hypothetical protein
MSGIRSTSGVPPALSATPQSSGSGPEPVAPVNPAQPAGGQTGLPETAAPKPAGHPLEATLVNAVVTAKTSGESIILHTDYGNFRLTTTAPLEIGNQITFEIDAIEDIIVARLISKDGKPFASPIEVKLLPVVNVTAPGPDGYVRAGQLHPMEVKAALQNITSSLPATDNKPKTLNTAPTPSNSVPLDRPAPAPYGGLSPTAIPAVPARLSSLMAYVKASPLIPGPNTSPAVAAAQNAATRMLQIVPAELMSASEKGITARRFEGLPPTALPQKMSLILRPQQTVSNPLQRPDIITGTVMSVRPPVGGNGPHHVQLSTPMGTLSYNTVSPPTAGATVEFAIADKISAFPLTYTDVQQPGTREPVMRIMGDWQNLRQAMNVIAVQDPVLAQSVLSTVLPQANSQMSSSLLFFMAALQLGSVDKWLGQDFKTALEASGRTALLRALEDDFGTFSRLQNESGGQDWKSLNFPFFDGHNLRQIRMFHRQNHQQDGTEDDDDTTRFVIELSLSRSGPIQLDGIFVPKRFDLVIRSEQEISSPMRHHILSLFTENMEISGMNGQLVFKTIAPFPVDPLAEWETGFASDKSF